MMDRLPLGGFVSLAVVMDLGLAAALLARPHAIDPGAPASTADATDLVAVEKVTAREEPAPHRCMSVDAIRVLRGHVETSIDRRIPVPEGDPLVAEPAIRLESGATFAIRFQPGGLDLVDQSLMASELRFGNELLPATLCVGDIWLYHEELAAPHGVAKLYTDAIVDAVE